MRAKKIFVRALFVFMAVLILLLAAGFALMTFSYAELSDAFARLRPGYVSESLGFYGFEPITMEPEKESYPKGTDEITFIINDPSGLGFMSYSDYVIYKEGYIFRVWPTRTGEVLWRGRSSISRPKFGREPSENGEPITMTYTLALTDWSWRPTRGTYTYETRVRVLINGVYETFVIGCDFKIE